MMTTLHVLKQMVTLPILTTCPSEDQPVDLNSKKYLTCGFGTITLIWDCTIATITHI